MDVSWESDRRASYLVDLNKLAVTDRGKYEWDEELHVIETITAKLGSPPLTYLLVDVLKNPESERLGMEVISHFSGRWSPCVFRNFSSDPPSGQVVWSMDELSAFFEAHAQLPL